MRHRPSRDRGAGALRALGRHRDDRQLDVGVRPLLVGIRVVAGVLVPPPSVAHPDEQVAHDEARPVVRAARREDLTAGGVMADEGDLREQDAEHGGGEELPPALTDQDERDERRDHRERQADQQRPVIAVPPPQKARGSDLVGERSEEPLVGAVAAVGRGPGRARARGGVVAGVGGGSGHDRPPGSCRSPQATPRRDCRTGPCAADGGYRRALRDRSVTLCGASMPRRDLRMSVVGGTLVS